jgi:NAD+ synthase (glutamine-hydrolysing)
VVRIALGQINTTVGDLDGNVEKMLEWSVRATDLGADLICFPELAITGYPPEDLVLRPEFIDDNLEALEALAKGTSVGCPIVAGFVDRTERGLHNAAGFLADGRIAARYHKMRLPNYGVFDERRYFVPGDLAETVPVMGELGLSVCEDAWSAGRPFDDYRLQGAAGVVNINGSPYHRHKTAERREICAARARDIDGWFVYVNAVGGQDELVFDGGSMVFDPSGALRWQASMFAEDLLVVEIPAFAMAGRADPQRESLATLPPAERASWPEGPEEVYGALELGLRDYVRKNGFAEVVIGLSGGIDSALTAVLATDALGARAVRTLAMPSRYSSSESLQDAQDVANRIDVRLDVVPIDRTFTAFLDTLAPLLEGTQPDVTEENVQARIRGSLLMAVSNKFGGLVLATGNKSEYAVGYSTLYGDMAGGFAPIKDVPKTLVYELSRWRNTRSDPAPIPDRVIDKPPSAELRPHQVDTDSLPPYEELDPIVEAYVEDDRSPEEIVAEGFDPTLVKRVAAMIDRAEYKRRQAAPGVKITPKAFGRDRRLPITNRYRHT